MTPVVSVLVLAYNHGRFLGDALESLVRQDAAIPFEILVGEDQSSDDTLAIARRYETAHPKVLRIITSDQNVGMQENLRRLVLASRGKYIAFCEGDDYWNSRSKLAQQVAFLEERPQFGAVHSDFTHIVRVDGTWKALPRYWRHCGVSIPQGAVFDELLQRNFIQTCTLMVRTDLAAQYVESDLPITTYKVGDWPLCLFVSAHALIGYIDEPLATYRRVQGSAMNQGFQSDVDRARDHMRMASDFCRSLDRPRTAEEAAHASHMQFILLRSLQEGRVAEAREAAAWLRNHAQRDASTFRTRLMRIVPYVPLGTQAFHVYAKRVQAAHLRNYDSAPQGPAECADSNRSQH